MKPLAIDLFCGLGGWAEGFLAEGYDVVGFDIERPDYGTGGYPGQLVIQDVLTLHGSQFRDAAVIVASPPCQKYSYMAMPWARAKEMARGYRESPERIPELNALFDACFRIQREASEADGRYIPLIVENVKGAQPWIGDARWHFGSYYLFGDVPALMPVVLKFKGYGGSWFAQNHNTNSGGSGNPVDGTGIKQNGSGPIWFDTGIASHPSQSQARKAASAQIAKILFPLARYIAQVYKPDATEETAA